MQLVLHATKVFFSSSWSEYYYATISIASPVKARTTFTLPPNPPPMTCVGLPGALLYRFHTKVIQDMPKGLFMYFCHCLGTGVAGVCMVTLSGYHMQRSPKLTAPPESNLWMNAILSIMTDESSRYISFRGAVGNH